MRRKRLILLCGSVTLVLSLAAVALAQTVRLQDRNTPNTAVVTAAGALLVDSGTAGGQGGLTCTSQAAISQVAGTQIIAGVTGQRTYICAVFLLSADAKNLSLVEGTGTVCATGTAGIIGGAAASVAVAANGGFVVATPTAFARTAGTNVNVCILQSTAGNVSGIVTFLQQ